MTATTSAPLKLGNKRVTGKEQFYTPESLAQALVRITSEVIPDLETKDVLEPAGGTGSFVEASRLFGVNSIVSFDIEPLHPEVLKADFLTEVYLDKKDFVTITNPPFGRNNSLSIPFFNKCAMNSDYIAFLVPRSWRKWSVTNRLDLSFHLLYDQDISVNYVSAYGEPLSSNSVLKTCFQIWKKEDFKRHKVSIPDFGVVSKCSFEEADVSLTIFGYGCGTVSEVFPRRPNTTQMFLKLNHPRALEALKEVDFSKFYRNTAYTEALSLMEINFLLNEYLGLR